MTEVLAVIFQIMSDGTFAIVTEPVRTTIEQCLQMAIEINIDPSHPYILFCATDISGMSV